MSYTQNLTLWMNKLPLTNIKIMFFYASDLTRPKVKTAFKMFRVKNKDYYVCEGQNTNFWYVYASSYLKYLMHLTPTNQVDLYDGAFLNTGNQYDVNHGDHLDFSIVHMRNGDALIKTHKTMYTDIGNYVFTRDSPECNYVYTPQKLKQLEQTYCEGPKGVVYNYKMKDIHSQDTIDIIRYLCEQMQIQHGGRSKQSGGAFLNAQSEIYSKIVKPITDKYKDTILSISVLHEDRKSHVIVLIDYVEYTRNILLVKWPLPLTSEFERAFVI